MGDSSSETPTESKYSLGSSSHDDLLYSFENLGLGMNVNNVHHSSIESISKSSLPKSQREESIYKSSLANTHKEEFLKRVKLPMIPEEESDEPECSSRPSIHHSHSTGAVSSSVYGGNSTMVPNLHLGNGSFSASANYVNKYNSCTEPYKSVGNLTGNTSTINSCCGEQSNTVNQFTGGKSFLTDEAYMMNHNLGLLHNSRNTYTNPRYVEPRTNGYYSGNGYYGNDNLGSCNASPNQELEICLVTLAKTQDGSKKFQDFIKDANFEDLGKIIIGFFPYLFELMIDNNGHHVFHCLIEACKRTYGLEAIVKKIISQSYLLTKAALCQHGSVSIQYLIKQLKRSQMASMMTLALSNGFVTLMTDITGRHVILQCFMSFDSRQNQELYEQAIKYYSQLATDPIGCLSLNECIDFITAPLRSRLLDAISEDSVHLSQDPSGNFVVQHILGLQDPYLTSKICHGLKNYYTRLSFVKYGSHLVEKCIRFSSVGMVLAVEEFMRDDRVHKLAQDQFGNYVLQAALRATKEAHSGLYQSLTSVLTRHIGVLEHHKTGKHVIKLIKDC